MGCLDKMTDQIDPALLTDVRDRAAYWYERMHSDDVTDAECAEFDVWCQADSQHVWHYRQIQQVWRMAHALPQTVVHQPGQNNTDVSVSRQQHRRAWLRYGIAGVATTVVSLAIIDHAGWFDTPEYQSTHHTVHGQRSQIRLPDGTEIWLNTGTVVTVQYYKNRRHVQLVEGEALFQVDGTRGLPFTVDAGFGTVRVTGTQFNVRRNAQDFSVGVLHGAVEVMTGPWWSRQQTHLLPGYVLHTDVHGKPVVQTDADVANTVAWRDGKIVFRGTVLTDVVNELNRYSRDTLTISDPRIASLRLSGVFSVDDMAAFWSEVPKILPVAFRRQANSPVVDIVPLL